MPNDDYIERDDLFEFMRDMASPTDGPDLTDDEVIEVMRGQPQREPTLGDYTRPKPEPSAEGQALDSSRPDWTNLDTIENHAKSVDPYDVDSLDVMVLTRSVVWLVAALRQAQQQTEGLQYRLDNYKETALWRVGQLEAENEALREALQKAEHWHTAYDDLVKSYAEFADVHEGEVQMNAKIEAENEELRRQVSALEASNQRLLATGVGEMNRHREQTEDARSEAYAEGWAEGWAAASDREPY